MPYRQFHNLDLGLRDVLALDRTVLANERTFLAYARTAIMLLVSAISLFKLFPDSTVATWGGILLFPLSVVVTALGIRRYLLLRRTLAELLRRQ